MSVDRSKLLFYSGDLIDKIIGIKSGTISVGAPTSSDGFLSVTDSQPHGFGDCTYFQGIFSTNNGATWNDFGSQIPYLSGASPEFQTADCNATVDGTNVNATGTSWYDFGNSRGVAYTFLYKIFLVAKNSMASPITPFPTDDLLVFSSAYNFQKIALQDTVHISVAAGSTGSVTITHNLGYVPKVRAWWFDDSTPTICQPITTGLTADPKVQISTTNVVFTVDLGSSIGFTKSGNIEYRIYYDD